MKAQAAAGPDQQPRLLIRRGRVIMLVASFAIGAGGLWSADPEHIVRAGYKTVS